MQIPTIRPLFAALVAAALFGLGAAPASAQLSPVGNLKVAKDFKAELVYNVPRAQYGSWVAACFDNKGRLIVADQYGGLYRVTLPAAGSNAQAQVEPIDLDIGGAHGLLYAFDSLYVMVNERVPQGIYRLRDTNGDDKYDEMRVIKNMAGVSEHGTHSLTLSPDGQSIWVVSGNATFATDFTASQHPMNVAYDSLLPVLGGFSDGQQPLGGYVMRIDKDGNSLERVAFGFRNPFDVSFNAEGEAFVYDADMELDIGLPWYRPTRVMHLTSGADYGWRTLTNKWPAYYFDSLAEVVNIGSGSPTGSAFGTGAKFPAKYQRAFFICDWSFGKLYAIHLTPNGSSYTGVKEEFIAGQPFPITDVLISPLDGAMYVTVGGRQTQSAVYRVTYIGTESTAPAPRETTNQAERDLRRRLEAFHGVQHESAVNTAWQHLASQDRALRYAARLAVEWQNADQWRERALSETNPRSAIAAIAALARASTKAEGFLPQMAPVPNPALQARMLAALDRINFASLGDADQSDLARAYSLVFTRTGAPTAADKARLAAKFAGVFPARTKEVNGLLARLLVYLESPDAPAKLVAAMRTAPTQQEQIDYALQLRLQKAGWTNALREEYLNWFVKAYANYRGGSAFLRGIVAIRTAALETFTPEERTALAAVIAITPTQVSPMERIVSRPFVKNWTVDELTPIVTRSVQQGGRDFEAGRRLFGEVACAVCHAYGSEGGTVGPDLTGSGGRYNVRDLLEAIIEPSKVISEQFAAMNFRLADGSTVTGRVVNNQMENVTIARNMFDDSDRTSVPRANIVEIEESPVSMMPPGLLNNLNETQIADLAAYLFSAGDRNHPAFRR